MGQRLMGNSVTSYRPTLYGDGESWPKGLVTTWSAWGHSGFQLHPFYLHKTVKWVAAPLPILQMR